MDIIRWVRSSVFVKMLLIILLAYLAATWASIETHRAIFKHPRFEKKMQNSVNFCNYIIDEIGIPVDTLRAAEIAEKLNIQLRIINDRFTWSFPREMRPIDWDKLSPLQDPKVRVGFDCGIQVDIQKDGVRYQFLLQSRRESMPYAAQLEMGLDMLYTTVLLILIYLALRWQLRPLGTLHNAVKRVASGDFDFEIDSRRHDELGTLVHSFNAMRQEIVEMIRGREQLLLDVSHEFRSPLTRMKVSLEMLEESEERANLIDDINELEAMVTELLEGARIQSPHGDLDLQDTDIRSILEEICRELEGRGPGVILRAGREETRLKVDAARIRILFKNIITNAVKYSPPDGKPAEITLEETEETVKITVRDYGCGIPEKELTFIFEPFYRVDKSRSKDTGGYGLGMHLSKKIVEAHGGKIDIESRVGEGTKIVLLFTR